MKAMLVILAVTAGFLLGTTLAPLPAEATVEYGTLGAAGPRPPELGQQPPGWLAVRPAPKAQPRQGCRCGPFCDCTPAANCGCLVVIDVTDDPLPGVVLGCRAVHEGR